MSKFEIELPIERWQTGEFLPKELEGSYEIKIISAKKNQVKKTASARIKIAGDDTVYTVEYADLNPVEKNGKAVLEKEEYSVYIENGKILEVN